MTGKLIWGILGGVILGASFGYIGGNTGVGIAICVAAGAIAAGVLEFLERNRRQKPGSSAS